MQGLFSRSSKALYRQIAGNPKATMYVVIDANPSEIWQWKYYRGICRMSWWYNDWNIQFHNVELRDLYVLSANSREIRQ